MSSHSQAEACMEARTGGRKRRVVRMRKEEEGQGAREKDDLSASITLLPPHWLNSIVGMLLSLNSSSSLLPVFPLLPLLLPLPSAVNKDCLCSTGLP